MSETNPIKALILSTIFFLSIIIVQGNTEPDEKFNWLMVQNAEGFELNVDETISADCDTEDFFWSGTLTLENVDNLSTWFTDRPARIAQELPVEHLTMRWDAIFTEETGGAPNAALVFDNQFNMSETIVVELQPPTHNRFNLTMTFSVCGIKVGDNTLPETVSLDSDVELFIDDVHYMSNSHWQYYSECTKNGRYGNKTDGSIWARIWAEDTIIGDTIQTVFDKDQTVYQIELNPGDQIWTHEQKHYSEGLPGINKATLDSADYIEFSVCLEYWNYYHPTDRIALLLVDDDDGSAREDAVIGALPYPDQSYLDWDYSPTTVITDDLTGYYNDMYQPDFQCARDKNEDCLHWVDTRPEHSDEEMKGYYAGTAMPKSWLFELPSDLENDVRWVQFGNEDDVWRNSTCSSDMTDSTCSRGYIWDNGDYLSNGKYYNNPYFS
tara:strand:+ start:630 stop:1943 length:1314 start_codon:yes stop_codon:yes gene_type:complete